MTQRCLQTTMSFALLRVGKFVRSEVPDQVHWFRFARPIILTDGIGADQKTQQTVRRLTIACPIQRRDVLSRADREALRTISSLRKTQHSTRSTNRSGTARQSTSERSLWGVSTFLPHIVTINAILAHGGLERESSSCAVQDPAESVRFMERLVDSFSNRSALGSVGSEFNRS